jgi:hypothetical protein
MVSAKPWPFDQPRNCAVFTAREVLEREEPILRVTHDTDDHGWQFLGSDARTEDAKIISLEEAVELDPSVLQVCVAGLLRSSSALTFCRPAVSTSICFCCCALLASNS